MRAENRASCTSQSGYRQGIQRRRTTGNDERRMHLRCLVEGRVAFPPLPTNVDTRAPLQGASTTARARQSKEEEIVIDRSTEIQNSLWIDEPEYHYDAETETCICSIRDTFDAITQTQRETGYLTTSRLLHRAPSNQTNKIPNR